MCRLFKKKRAIFSCSLIVCFLVFYSASYVWSNDTEHAFKQSETTLDPKDPAAWQSFWFDQRRAIKNDAQPAQRKEPKTKLPPLPKEKRGIIRNVTPFNGEKTVALTFDLCELDTVTTGCDMEVLGYLHSEHLPATLFMGGKWMRTHTNRVMQLMQEPLFEIANHAWSHGNAALLSKEGLRAQVLWTQAQYEIIREKVLQNAHTGVNTESIPPVPVLFRLPYGRSSEQALEEIANLGLFVVQWDVVAEGGAIRTPSQAKKCAARLLPTIHPGSILLFHANCVPQGTSLLLKEIVDALKEKGFGFCTVTELLKRGKQNTVSDGYFVRPLDNRALDTRFGIDGTGRKQPFLGKERF
ncbi:MAG: polysaccharide deacetylase family protein [Desulfovibrio sp.]|nr:polysaccharide deacetylase family protein [Desulfovibrio sp.]